MGPDVQADRARHGGWGRERSITDRPGSALPDFDLTGPGVLSPRTDINRVIMHWKLSNLFFWSSNSILCLCFCCIEEERKCLIKVPKKPQDRERPFFKGCLSVCDGGFGGWGRERPVS
jgi:hypothetical protein